VKAVAWATGRVAIGYSGDADAADLMTTTAWLRSNWWDTQRTAPPLPVFQTLLEHRETLSGTDLSVSLVQHDLPISLGHALALLHADEGRLFALGTQGANPHHALRLDETRLRPLNAERIGAQLAYIVRECVTRCDGYLPEVIDPVTAAFQATVADPRAQAWTNFHVSPGSVSGRALSDVAWDTVVVVMTPFWLVALATSNHE
jgi:hypothetical protein